MLLTRCDDAGSQLVDMKSRTERSGVGSGGLRSSGANTVDAGVLKPYNTLLVVLFPSVQLQRPILHSRNGEVQE